MIGVTVEKAHGNYDPGTSKFLGAPTMPEEWLSDGTIGDDDFFFCQLRFSEFCSFDKKNTIPQKGFLYIFLREDGDSYIPNVCYTDTEPDTLIDDFNAGFDFLGDTSAEYSIDYFETESSADGTRLFAEEGEDIHILQYDPLDDNMPEFLSETEKIAYFTITKEELSALDFSNVRFTIK